MRIGVGANNLMKPHVGLKTKAIYSPASIVLRALLWVELSAGRILHFFYYHIKSYIKAIFLCSLVVCSTTPTLVNSSSITEYELKAVFLYKLLKYVSTDAASQAVPSSLINTRRPTSGLTKARSTFGGDNETFICVIGSNPFEHHLDRVVDKVNARRKRPIEVKYMRRFEQEGVSGCDLVFLAKSEQREIARVVEGLQQHSILTVSDIEGFAQRKGMVEFVFANGSIQMEINVLSASRSSLSISANLLEVAKKIYK